MASKLVKSVEDILKKYKNVWFSANEIATKIVQEDKQYIKSRKDSDKTAEDLKKQIACEVYSANSTDSYSEYIKVTSGRPKKFAYFSETDAEEVERVEQGKSKDCLLECDLYPKLGEFLYNILRIYPKRINEKLSSKTKAKNANKWLHPDIVGLQNISESWCCGVNNCINAQNTKHIQTSLWSFEVKLKINSSNVREVFFQTVSNSSWANYSYLVASYIDDKALKELKILCKSYNIGVIKLDVDTPNESEIVIQATEKVGLDWNIINRIYQVNPDFKDFIDSITDFYKTDKIRITDWNMMCS